MKCDDTCELCEGLGLVGVVGSDGFTRYEVCPNMPFDYRGTGVNESDRDIPKLLEKSATVTQIGNALKDLRKTGYGLLWIQGGFGIGKTVLAKAATVEAFAETKSALYIRQLEMINRLRSSYADDKGQALILERKEEITSKKWLVIDEIGRVNETAFSEEVMGDIVDNRYQQALRHEAMTVLISNSFPDDVLDPYLVDRIMDVKCKQLVINGKSLRRNKQ